MRLEHFTAAQGAGLGTVGFGLEQPNTPTLAQPADDFESFVSTHLGFEPEEQVAGAQVIVRSPPLLVALLPWPFAFGMTCRALHPRHVAHLVSAGNCMLLQ